MLARLGHDLHFLLRSDFEAVKNLRGANQESEGGLSLLPPRGSQPEEIGVCDVVLIAL